MATAGELLPTDFLWKEGMKDWVQANSTSLVFPNSDEDAATVIMPDAAKEDRGDPDLNNFLNSQTRPKPRQASAASDFDFMAASESEAAEEPLEDEATHSDNHDAYDEESLISQSKFAAVDGEEVCFQGMGAWSEGIATHSGTIILTTRRVAFCQPAGFDGGLLLIHAINLATRAHDQIVWQLMLPDIASAHRKKHLGFGRKTVLTARDGTTYALVIDGEAWRSAWHAAGIRLSDSTGDPAIRHRQAAAVLSPTLVPDRQASEATAAQDTTAEDEWHINVRGESHGPVGYTELQAMYHAGEVAADDLVWKEGMEKWALASSVLGTVAVHRKPKGPPPITEVEKPSAGPTLESFVFETANTARKSATRISQAKPVKGFHLQRIIVGIASGVGMVSTFLPWARIPIVGTIDGTFNGDGWITLGLYAAAVVCVFREPHGKMFAGRQKLVAGICPALAALIGIYTLSNIGNARRAIDDHNLFGAAIKGSFQAGIGLYFVALCGIVAAVAVFALPEDKRSSR